MTTKYINSRTVFALAAALTVSLSAQAQSVPPTTTDPTLGGQGSSADTHSSGTHAHASTQNASKKDTSFVKDAIEDNQREIAMAEVAQRKTQNQELKQFAQQLKDDHTAANQQLMQIAQTMGITVDRDVSSKHEKQLAKFNKMSASEFDKEFAEASLKEHQKDIEKYHKASEKIENPQLKEYVVTTLPKLHKHFHHAETIAKAVGVDEKTIASYADKLPPAVGGSSDSTGTATGTSSKSDLKSPKEKSNDSDPTNDNN